MMGRRLSVTRVARAVALVCALAALLVPGVAMAAGGASFSSATPKSGSYFMGQTPKVSVTVYDKDGVRGSANYALYVDGAKVRPSISYVAGYGYRKFKLTYQVTRPLSVGASHKIKATVKDRGGRSSSYSWSFYADSSAPAAVFGSPSPQDGSRVLDVRPTIAISVLDRWNVAASGVRLTMDGASVVPQVTFANPHALSVSFRPASALSAGTHTVALSVRDAGGRTTSTSWSFAVYPDMPTSGSACADCHAGFPAAHPMTACASCHGAGAPPRPAGGVMAPYTASDTSAHTLACSLESPCHGGGGDFPHTLDSDCMRCHTGTYSGIPAWHGPLSAVPHTSTSAFCTSEGCHFSSLTVEHFRYTSGGAPLSCATCHASTDASVAAAIAAGDTACTSCHSFATSTHPGTGSVHALPEVSCTVAGCHGTDLASVHKGDCSRCHAPGVTASSDCSSCHPPQPHTGLDAIHAAPALSCTDSKCHGGNAMAIHLPRGALACSTCHAPTATKTLDCTVCHGSVEATIHAAGNVPHTVTGDCAIDGCHVKVNAGDVTVIHAAGPGCAACHAAGTSPSNRCSTCHAAGSYHDGVDKLHAWSYPGATCIVSGCHSSDVSVVHRERGARCTACHAPGKTPSTTCSDCHTNVGHAGLAVHNADSNSACFSSTCHTTNVLVIHGNNCAACHAPGRTPSTNCITCHASLHSNEAQSHVITDGCAATGCHQGDAEKLHAYQCGRCHFRSDKPASLVCADCHKPHTELPAHMTDTMCATCHGRDVSIIHTTGATKPGCVTCHATGKTPTIVCATAGCHGAGLPASHSSHVSTVTAGDITINGAPYGSHACSECHASLELQTIHGGATSCLKCHPDPASSARDGDFTCAQGGCHTADSGNMKAFHGGIDAAHTAASAPSCTAAGCHSGGSDVAKIHAPKLGCATCHGGGKTPTLDCSAVGCHAGGAPASHASHESTVTSGLIRVNGTSYGPYDCSLCHASLELQTIHGGKGTCLKCHPNPASTARDGDFTCAQGGCHITAAGDMQAMHAGADAIHTLAAQPSCVGTGCHAGGADVAAIHDAGPGCSACHGGGKTPTLACSSCHDFVDHTALHEVTRGSADTCGDAGCHPDSNANLTTLHPTCATCHADTVRDAVKTAIAGHDTSCSACHNFTDHISQHAVTVPSDCANAGCHVSTNLTALHPSCTTCHSGTVRQAVKDAIAAGSKACASCHAAPHSASHVWCARCHTHVPGDPNDPQLPYEEGGPNHWPLTINGRSCANCHGAPFRPLAGIGVSHGGCGFPNCHFGGSLGQPTADQHYVDRTKDTCSGSSCHAATLSNLTVLHATNGCATCHADTVRDAVKTAIATNSKACSACHAFTDHVSMHAVVRNDGCVGSTCHPATNANLTTLHPTCATCHADTVRDAVKNAIATNNKTCSACHTAAHAASHQWCNDCHSRVFDDSGYHDPALVPDTRTCASCHGTSFQPIDGHAWVTANYHCGASCHGHGFGDQSRDLHSVDRAADSCSGASCHPASANNLTNLHPTLGCATCHASTVRDAVKTAIANHNKACSACHPFSDHVAQHAVTRGTADTCGDVGCHPDANANLTTLHPTCATCHADTVRDAIKNAIASNNKVCSACHTFADHTAQHAVLRGVSDTCGDVGCHLDSNANLTTLHPTCATCHADTVRDAVKTAIATNNKACSACHPFTDHMSQHAVTRGTADTCGDAGCHPDSNANLTTLHPTLGCATCHADTVRDAVKAAIASNNKACSACHPFSDHVSQHAVTRGVADTCGDTGCHPDSNANLMTLHPTCDTCHADTVRSAVKTAVGGHNKACAACHPFTDHTQQHDVDRTKDSCAGAACHPATLSNLATIHPAGCATCHATGVSQTVKDAIAAHDKNCMTCHTLPHAASHQWCNNCHEDLYNITHGWDIGHYNTSPMPNQPCSNCHGTTFQLLSGIGPSHNGCSDPNCHHFVGSLGEPTADLHYVVRNDACAGAGCHAATNTNLTTLHPTLSCATCHSATVRQTVKDAIAAGNKACSACHGTGLPASHASHVSTVTAGAISINGTNYGSHNCNECHASMDLQVVHVGATCAKCHPAPANTVPKGSFACSQAGCHVTAAGNMQAQHGTINADHTVATQPTCVQEGCHGGGKDVAAMHSAAATTTVSAGSLISCQVCHKSPQTPSTTCTSCHDTATPHGDVAALHTGVSSTAAVAIGMDNYWHSSGDAAWLNCSDCHVMDILAVHANNCQACHAASARAAVKNAIAAHDRQCASCHVNVHDGSTPIPEHQAEYDSGNYDCGTCHGLGCYCHSAVAPTIAPVTTSDAQTSYIGNAVIHLTPSDGVKGSFGIKRTYYRLDGGAETTGTLISVPAPAAGSVAHTLVFWSTDWSGNIETSHTVNFTVAADTIPPVTTVNVTPNQNYIGDVTFTITPSDLNSGVLWTKWRLDGGSWFTGTTVAVPMPTTGTAAHVLYYYSADTVGNVEAVHSVTFSVTAGKVLSYTGTVQTVTLPASIAQFNVDMTGGRGGTSYNGLAGGSGGRVSATIPVPAGSTLSLYVAGAGSPAYYHNYAQGGWPNGGRGYYNAGAGGGSSSVWVGTTELVEAGGGGGSGYSLYSSTPAGQLGGSQGSIPGGFQTGGTPPTSLTYTGGGGGGWNAGAAGATKGSGGGGGTSYIAVGTGTLTAGANSTGNGTMTVTW